jgi:hypothetical protein
MAKTVKYLIYYFIFNKYLRLSTSPDSEYFFPEKVASRSESEAGRDRGYQRRGLRSRRLPEKRRTVRGRRGRYPRKKFRQG